MDFGVVERQIRGYSVVWIPASFSLPPRWELSWKEVTDMLSICRGSTDYDCKYHCIPCKAPRLGANMTIYKLIHGRWMLRERWKTLRQTSHAQKSSTCRGRTPRARNALVVLIPRARQSPSESLRTTFGLYCTASG